VVTVAARFLTSRPLSYDASQITPNSTDLMMSQPSSSLPRNCIRQQDCVSGLRELPAGSVDLAFADPPFNIGYDYDVYDDRLEAEKYLDWSREWLSEIVRVLKSDGTFWLAIGDEFAAELKVLMQRELGLHCRSWVIWYYTFGVNCKQKFSRSHAHLLYMVKDARKFTFQADDPDLRVPSARQLVYGDKRANAAGRLPDDMWMLRPPALNVKYSTRDGWILRPQDIPDAFDPSEDTWYYPRVNGTFKERKGWHGCQMPEQVLGRIIRACSRPGELVLDPFTGSGTTLAVAKKLGREFLGFELSEQYAARANERLSGVSAGDPLDGVVNPIDSVPSTDKGIRLDDRTARLSGKIH
jgi:site-specific DNA-methyltransferase (adenine-specific)